MNAILKNILISVGATMALAVIYFFGEKLFYPTPDVSGNWHFVTKVEKASYKPFLGMELTYNVYLNQDDLKLVGTGEKIKEKVNGTEKDYIGTERIQLEITGRIEKQIFGDDVIYIQYKIFGKLRDSTARQRLTHHGDALRGSFSSTIADESGIVGWKRRKI